MNTPKETWTDAFYVEILRPVGVVESSWKLMSDREKLILLGKIKMGKA